MANWFLFCWHNLERLDWHTTENMWIHISSLCGFPRQGLLPIYSPFKTVVSTIHCHPQLCDSLPEDLLRTSEPGLAKLTWT